MKYLKRYKKFFEDGDSSGSGDVVSAQPNILPGETGTTGSGDVGFVFKKEKRKKGSPSEVTDMRDLEDASDEINKVSESYSKQDVFIEVTNHLKLRNLTPIDINKIMDSFENEITEMYNDGFNISQIIEKVVSLLGHESDDTYLGLQPPTSPKPITFM